MPLRLAVLSFWHVHAADYARRAREHPGTEITAVWDEDRARGRQQAAEFGAEFHPDLGGLLARDDVDAVIVTCPTAMHRAVITAAAAAGKHVFTEKVLAPTTRECAHITDAVEKSGVLLMLAMPRLYAGYTAAIRRVLADGELGRLTLVRIRLAHGGSIEDRLPEHFYDPAAAAGGALIDLGCHPMYLARLFLGRMPETVTASFGHITQHAVEDNAVAVLRCADGALGVLEASFTAPASEFTIELHGTRGSLVYRAPEQRLLLSTADGTRRELPVPESAHDPFDLFVRHVAEGTRDEENLALGLDLTRLMAAATVAAREEGTLL